MKGHGFLEKEINDKEFLKLKFSFFILLLTSSILYFININHTTKEEEYFKDGTNYSNKLFFDEEYASKVNKYSSYTAAQSDFSIKYPGGSYEIREIKYYTSTYEILYEESIYETESARIPVNSANIKIELSSTNRSYITREANNYKTYKFLFFELYSTEKPTYTIKLKQEDYSRLVKDGGAKW